MPGAEGPPRFREVFADSDLLVLEKPSGLVVHEAPSHVGETLVDQLSDRGRGGDPTRPGIVHRLDKDTSGLMVVALSEEGFVSLSEQIGDRSVERHYLALVEGRPASRSGTIDAPIGRSRKDRIKMQVGGVAARPATTHFEVERDFPKATLVRAKLETGRTHQIRVHFEAIGSPVIGDPVYGGKEAYGLDRQFLHSESLSFEHPRTGETMRFTSDLPGDLMQALERAEGDR